MYFVEKLLECSKNFEKYLMEQKLHRRKKFARECRPLKSAVLTSLKNVAYFKRNQLKYDDAQNKKEKNIKKR